MTELSPNEKKFIFELEKQKASSLQIIEDARLVAALNVNDGPFLKAARTRSLIEAEKNIMLGFTMAVDAIIGAKKIS